MNEQTSEHVSAVAPSGVARLIAHVKAMAPVRTAVVHPCDALSLGGALDARDAGIITPVLVAPLAKLRAVAADFGLDLGDSEIVDVPHSHAAAATAARLAGKGEVQALMKGSLHSDEYLGAMNMPTRRELRTLQDRVQEARRETKRLRSELDALKRQIGGTATAAAPAATPVATATPAKPAAPRKKAATKARNGSR